MEFPILLIGKVFALIAVGLYIIFAMVIVKQVGLMTKTVEVGLEGLIRFIAWAHLAFAVGVFLVALSIL